MDVHTKPDGYMPDGTPVYIQCARGSSKSYLQLEIYRRLCGISDEKWAEMKQTVMEQLGYSDDQSDV